jgi:hypothetical protein
LRIGGDAANYLKGLHNEPFSGTLGSDDPPQDTVPTDLKARVQDITGNCSEFLDIFLNALSKYGKVFSHDFGKLLDRIQTVSTASDEFFAKNNAPSYAAGLSLGGDNNRQIYIRSNAITATTAANNQQFRWNAIAQITIAELLHQSKSNGRFPDPELDRAAVSLMNRKQLDDAKALMSQKNYAAGSVGHTLVKSTCRPILTVHYQGGDQNDF